jgi:hypothetical protein
MSLPSVVIFYKGDEEVRRQFINCGWFCNNNTVKNGIKRSLINSGNDFEWDVAKAYGMSFTKEEVGGE